MFALLWKPVMIVSVSEVCLGEQPYFITIVFYLDGEIKKLRVFSNHQFHSYFKIDDPRRETKVLK